MDLVTSTMSNQMPSPVSTLLMSLLPIPHCPWSHSTLDFIICLSLSEGNKFILTCIDHISEDDFAALPKLSFACETTDLLLLNVFCLHGLLANKVSDRGSQFIFHV